MTNEEAVVEINHIMQSGAFIGNKDQNDDVFSGIKMAMEIDPVSALVALILVLESMGCDVKRYRMKRH